MLCVQVWDVDCGAHLLRVVISEQSSVLELPSKEIVDDHNGGRCVGACNITRPASEFSFVACGLAVPSEALKAAVTSLHPNPNVTVEDWVVQQTSTGSNVYMLKSIPRQTDMNMSSTVDSDGETTNIAKLKPQWQ